MNECDACNQCDVTCLICSIEFVKEQRVVCISNGVCHLHPDCFDMWSAKVV